MVITKPNDLTKVSVKYSEKKIFFGRVSYYLLFEFEWEGEGVGAHSRLGANKLFLPSGWALIRINMVSVLQKTRNMNKDQQVNM